MENCKNCQCNSENDIYQNVYLAIAYLYIVLGICFMAIDQHIPRQYMAIVVYFVFKMVTQYDKCTLSYIECKLRNVKKENGYLYDFLHSIVSLRDTPHANYFYIIAFIFVIFYLQQR